MTNEDTPAPTMINLFLYIVGTGTIKLECKEAEREQYGNELRCIMEDYTTKGDDEPVVFHGYGLTFAPRSLAAFMFSPIPQPRLTVPGELEMRQRELLHLQTTLTRLAIEEHNKDHGEDWMGHNND